MVNPRWEENLSITTSILGAQASWSPSPHGHGIGPGLTSTILFCLGEGSRTLGQALGRSFPSDQATQAGGSCLGLRGRAKRQESHGVTQHPPALISQRPQSASGPGTLVEASSGCRVGSREGGEVMREAKPRSRRLLRAPRGPHRWLIVACQSSRPEWDRALGGWEEIESEPLQGELFSLIQQLRLFPSTLIFFFFLLLCTKKSSPDSIMSPRLLSLQVSPVPPAQRTDTDPGSRMVHRVTPLAHTWKLCGLGKAT